MVNGLKRHYVNQGQLEIQFNNNIIIIINNNNNKSKINI